ncbi:cytochrome P450 [Rickenella mellea]|uniref:Cytochrome P450 n=1 Tax=Rickenella mellea TaxID=50990 RepID=A0A4Y7QF33_9AGAM|nr:cytochrome P450 [Rickenella mellea]
MDHILVLAILASLFSWLVYSLFVRPRSSPLRGLPGPDPTMKFLGFGGHLNSHLNVMTSKRTHEENVRKYGKSYRIKGIGNWEDRLITTDPVAMAHVLNRTLDYEKPWQSRRVITRLIGEGMLAAEGQVHKRMRRVGTPAFSIQNMRALIPVVFSKAHELKDKWTEIIKNEQSAASEKGSVVPAGSVLDVCKWISRATFDVIGLAGFDYNFSAIQNESNELFLAYKEMFEVAVSQAVGFKELVIIYFPWIERIFPDYKTRTIKKSQEIIYRVGRELVQDKKKRIMEGERTGKDLLSLLLKSNMSKDIDPAQRISDDDILNNINTFFFAGSDTSSLALTWAILILAEHPHIQKRLRAELLTIANPTDADGGDLSTSTSLHELYATIDELPYLNNVVRETLRVVPPVHSSLRMATKDDEIPTAEAVRMRDGSLRWGIRIQKGELVHIPVESMNVDTGVWGKNACEFVPERWDNLPEAVLEQPGLYANLLTFSAGPRSCIGMRFSIIEMKTFLYVLLTSFTFTREPTVRICPANVVLTRPFVVGKYKEGSQCPLIVTPYVPGSDDATVE